MTSDSKQPFHIGVDIGSSKVRSVLCDMQGHEVAVASRPVELIEHEPGMLYYGSDTTLSLTLDCIAEVAQACPAPERIAGIAAASIGESFILYDENGQAMDDAIFWNDYRAEPELQEILALRSTEEFQRTLHNYPSPILAFPKLVWTLRHRPPPRQAIGALVMADWLAYKLSGVAATNTQLGNRWGAADMLTDRWDYSLIDALQVPRDLLPDILLPGEKLGTVLPEMAARLGLPASCTVGVGGHDHVIACLTLGLGIEDSWVMSLGTAGSITRLVDKPAEITDPDIYQGCIATVGERLRRYYMIGAVHECCLAFERFRRTHGNPSYEELESLAQKGVAGAASFAVDAVLGAAVSDAEWLAKSFAGSAEPADRYLALIESISDAFLEFAALIETMSGQTTQGKSRGPLKVIGGGRRYKSLLKVLQSRWGEPVYWSSTDEAAALGAALLGAVAAGSVPDYATAVAGLDIDWRPVDD